MASKLTLNNIPIEYFIERIKNKERFTFSRYGDGEWFAILGKGGQNCDGVKYTPELTKALVSTVIYPHQDEHFYYGMLKIALKVLRNNIERFHSIYDVDIPWIEGTFMVNASRQGEFYPLLSALRERKIIYVGPRYLRSLNSKMLEYREFVEVPDTKAFESYVDIMNKVFRVADHGDLIGISMGPGAKKLIYDLHFDLKKTHTIIDFGSLFDGYVGRPSRKYMKAAQWSTTIIRNINP